MAAPTDLVSEVGNFLITLLGLGDTAATTWSDPDQLAEVNVGAQAASVIASLNALVQPLSSVAAATAAVAAEEAAVTAGAVLTSDISNGQPLAAIISDVVTLIGDAISVIGGIASFAAAEGIPGAADVALDANLAGEALVVIGTALNPARIMSSIIRLRSGDMVVCGSA